MTSTILWDEKYSVGNSIIDDQHKNLIAQCNRLSNCIDASSTQYDYEYQDILHELAVYTREHFTTEESILTQCRYPKLGEHKKEHVVFRDYVYNCMEDAASGKVNKVDLQQFLAKWWSEHILDTDMQYRDFLKNKPLS